MSSGKEKMSVMKKMSQKEFENHVKNCCDFLFNTEKFTPEKQMDHILFFLFFKALQSHYEQIGFPESLTLENIKKTIKNEAMGTDKIIKKFLETLSESDFLHIFRIDFSIQQIITFEYMFEWINAFDFNNDLDYVGQTYEYLLNFGMSNISSRGEFFTPEETTFFSVEQDGPPIFIDKKVPRTLDPFCGSGRFLVAVVRYYNHFLTKELKTQQEKNQIIKEFWKTNIDSLYGIDVNPINVRGCILNLMIHTKNLVPTQNVICGDSFSFNKNSSGFSNEDIFGELKFHRIRTNPPFGSTGFKYGLIQNEIVEEKGKIIKKEVKYPFVSPCIQSIGIWRNDKSDVGLMLVMSKLEKGGKACIVLPNGFYSGTNLDNINVKKYLCENFNITKIFNIPKKINHLNFSCILNSKDKKQFKNAYKGTGTNTSIMFFENNGLTNQILWFNDGSTESLKNHVSNASLKDLIEKNFNLQGNSYIEKIYEEKMGFEWKTLGEVCEIQFGKRITKNQNSGTLYPVYGGGYESFRTDSYNREGETCKIARFGMTLDSCVLILKNQKYYLLDSAFTIVSSNIEKYFTKYIWYILLNKKKEIYQTSDSSSCQRNIDIEMFKNIQFPIPSLKHQEKIVEFFDFKTKQIEREKERIKDIPKHIQYILENKLEILPTEEKILGEVCEIQSGKYITQNMKIIGEYPVYGGGNISFFINQWNRENEIIVAKDGMSKNCIRYEKNKFFLNHHGWTLNCKTNIIKKFLYYILLINQENIFKLSNGTAQQGINQETFYSIKTFIPSLKDQQKILEEIEFIESQEQQSQKMIETCEKEIIQFIENFIPKLSTQDEIENINDIENYSSTNSSNVSSPVKFVQENEEEKELETEDEEKIMEMCIESQKKEEPKSEKKIIKLIKKSPKISSKDLQNKEKEIPKTIPNNEKNMENIKKKKLPEEE